MTDYIISYLELPGLHEFPACIGGAACLGNPGNPWLNIYIIGVFFWFDFRICDGFWLEFSFYLCLSPPKLRIISLRIKLYNDYFQVVSLKRIKTHYNREDSLSARGINIEWNEWTRMRHEWTLNYLWETRGPHRWLSGVCQNDRSALPRRNPTNLFKSNKWIFDITVLKDLFRFVRFLAPRATWFTFGHILSLGHSHSCP